MLLSNRVTNDLRPVPDMEGVLKQLDQIAGEM